MTTTKVEATFVNHLADAAIPSLGATAVNPRAARDQATAILDALGRLAEYRSYLADARRVKATMRERGLPVGGVDREAVTNGRHALEDVQQAAKVAAALVDDLHRGGALQPRIEAWHDATRSSGSVSVGELWTWVNDQRGARGVLLQVGLTEPILAAVDEQVSTLDVKATTNGSRIVVSASHAGRETVTALETAAEKSRTTDLADLLARARYETAVAALKVGSPAYLYGTGPISPRAEATRAHRLVVDGAGAFLQEGVRHVRGLEDSGLATHRGGDPGTAAIVLFAIGLALFAAGVVTAFLCNDGKPPTNPTACSINETLWNLAFLFFLGAWGEDAKKNGGALVNGVFVPM